MCPHPPTFNKFNCGAKTYESAPGPYACLRGPCLEQAHGNRTLEPSTLVDPGNRTLEPRTLETGPCPHNWRRVLSLLEACPVTIEGMSCHCWRCIPSQLKMCPFTAGGVSNHRWGRVFSSERWLAVSVS